MRGLTRSRFTQSALISSAILAALMLLVIVFAYWTWVWLAPRPVPRARAAELPLKVEAAYGLFGGSQRSRAVAAPTGIAIRLLGVAAAAGGKSGYAVVQLDAGNILAVREGADIAPGIRLSEVRAEQIILDRNGVRETLALPEKASRAREAAAPPLPPRQTYPAAPPARVPGTDQR